MALNAGNAAASAPRTSSGALGSLARCRAHSQSCGPTDRHSLGEAGPSRRPKERASSGPLRLEGEGEQRSALAGWQRASPPERRAEQKQKTSKAAENWRLRGPKRRERERIWPISSSSQRRFDLKRKNVGKIILWGKNCVDFRNYLNVGAPELDEYVERRPQEDFQQVWIFRHRLDRLVEPRQGVVRDVGEGQLAADRNRAIKLHLGELKKEWGN